MEFIEQFNEFFKGKAEIKITNEQLEIKIGTLIAIFTLPELIKACNDKDIKDIKV